MSEPTTLTLDSAARKDIPLARGVLDYFPAALAEVAKLSKAGNDKHNPGEELHHARGKSTDHADCIMRHLMERGTVDTDGFLHEVKVAWRALALLQEALEQRGAPLARGAKLPNEDARPTQGNGSPTQGNGSPTQGNGSPTQGNGSLNKQIEKQILGPQPVFLGVTPDKVFWLAADGVRVDLRGNTD